MNASRASLMLAAAVLLAANPASPADAIETTIAHGL